MDIRTLVEDFTARLGSLIEGQVIERARVAIDGALGSSNGIRGAKPRKKGPKQLCPVPGCKNPAAPVFGMVCADHKNLPKAQIKKYREARRAKKLKAAA
ncbi:MAG TPA: hypothetical protein VIF57_30470 [Polyangia bacterium]|jgi:hypothetical protein